MFRVILIAVMMKRVDQRMEDKGSKSCQQENRREIK